MKRIALVVVLLFLAALVVPAAQAQYVVDPNTPYFSRTYSEWSAEWWQWALSVPVATHPLFDHGDCSVGQSGPVWFLGGKFCANNDPNCGTNHIVRSCTVLSGKSLYIAVLNAENSVLETNPQTQIADLRAMNASAMDGSANLSFTLDHMKVSGLKKNYRVQSTAFTFTMPDDNLFTAIGEGPFPGGSYFPAVDDGVYVMLSPLPFGQHQIHFHGAYPQWNFVLDITYNITVTK